MSGSRHIWKLPLDQLAAITSLQSLDLRGCTSLKFPPSWITERGGEVTWNLLGKRTLVLDPAGLHMEKLPEDAIGETHTRCPLKSAVLFVHVQICW
jgi:hypothetical protein